MAIFHYGIRDRKIFPTHKKFFLDVRQKNFFAFLKWNRTFWIRLLPKIENLRRKFFFWDYRIKMCLIYPFGNLLVKFPAIQLWISFFWGLLKLRSTNWLQIFRVDQNHIELANRRKKLANFIVVALVRVFPKSLLLSEIWTL